MKRKLIFSVLAITTMFSASGCNKQIVDFTYKYDRAIVSLPNKEIIEGEVDGWTDYEDGDQIQVTINGKTYLVHSEDIVLISE